MAVKYFTYIKSRNCSASDHVQRHIVSDSKHVERSAMQLYRAPLLLPLFKRSVTGVSKQNLLKMSKLGT